VIKTNEWERAHIARTGDRKLGEFRREVWYRNVKGGYHLGHIRCRFTGSSLTAKVAGGCSQGGVLSPLLWNLVPDRLLTAKNDIGFRTFGYAEDVVIIVQGKFAHTVREIMQKPWTW